MIGGRVLDVSTLIGFALVQPYPQALVWTAVEESMVPHRHVFFSVPDGDIGAIERALPRFRQRAHIAAVVPRAYACPRAARCRASS